MQININHVSLHQVLIQIAEQFGASEISYLRDETTIVVPYEHGKGYVRGINFRNGLGLLIFHCTFNEGDRLSLRVGTLASATPDLLPARPDYLQVRTGQHCVRYPGVARFPWYQYANLRSRILLSG